MITPLVQRLPGVRDKLVIWKNGPIGIQAIDLGGFQTLDRPISTHEQPWRAHAFCTTEGFVDVPVPDFVFGGWPEVGIADFDATADAIRAAGEAAAQLAVVGWIGSAQTHPVREDLLRLGREHPELLDIQQVEWAAPEPAATALPTSAGNALTLPEQVGRWAALLDVEGKGYSGRLKLLLHSGRPVLLQARPWREWFWDQLVPMEHFVPVQRDLSDLVDKARWVKEHPEAAARVGRAGQKLARHLLSRASAVEQWAGVLAVASQHPRAGWAPPALEDALEPTLRRIGAAG